MSKGTGVCPTFSKMKTRPIDLPMAIPLANGEMATHLLLAEQALFQQRIERNENKVSKANVQDRLLSKLRELGPILRARTTASFVVEQTNDGCARIRCADDDIRQLVALASGDHAKLATDYPCYEFYPGYRQLLKLLKLLKGYFSPDAYLNIKHPPQNAAEIAEFADRLVKVFCKVLRRRWVKKIQANFERSACDNFQGLLKNTAAIAERYSAVVVLSFATLFRPAGSVPVEYGDEPQLGHLPEFLMHRTRFHRWLRKRFKSDLLLYAWTVEHGRETGLHKHYEVILKPRGNEDHVELVEEIGRKWASITCGLGSIHNGNRSRSNYRFRALGLVRMDDPSVITGLQLIASYLTLAGVYVKLRVRAGVDTFGKGGLLGGDGRQSIPKAGRPPKRPSPMPIAISAAQGRARYVNFM